MAWISSEAALETQKGAVRPAIFMRIDSDPVARAWSGVGDFHLDQDVVETEVGGAIYKGTGLISNMPAFEALLNGAMSRLDVTISGVAQSILDMVDAAIADVEGAAIHFGLSFLDADQQPVAAPLWMIEGAVDELSTDRQPGVRSVSLSAAYGAVDRRRPALAWLTQSDQQRRHAGDRCCDRMPLYDAGRQLVFPKW